jgi:hypothetical protein
VDLKILAFSRKTGRFEKYWRFPVKQVDLKNIGAFQKKQADDRILAGVEIPTPGEKSAGLENTGGPLTV